MANAFFNIDLSLPQPSKSTNLGGLITNLPNFNQSFESLENFDYLGNFIVQGSVGSITADVRAISTCPGTITDSRHSMYKQKSSLLKALLQRFPEPSTRQIQSFWNPCWRMFSHRLLSNRTDCPFSPVGANVSLYNDAQGAHPPTMLQVTTGVGNRYANPSSASS